MSILWGKRVPAVVATIGLLAAGCGDDGARTDDTSVEQTDEAAAGPPGRGVAPDEPSAVGNGSVVDVRVVNVRGYDDGDLAGIVTRDADGLVVGGFAVKVDEDPFATTQRVLQPADPETRVEPWPHLSDENAVLAPGAYVLTLWADTGLSGYTRWFPMNSDGRGLAGCVQQFEVGEHTMTEVVVGGDVQSTGYVGMCEPSFATADDVAWGPLEADLVEPERVTAAAPFVEEFSGDTFAMVQELLVWRDEFLAVGLVTSAQPLPAELPAEIAEQFPPEIQALFPDGLPDTLDEATAIIEAAGLMDEAQEAVAAIPGAYDAIFLLDPAPPSYSFARSADGTEWEQLEVTLPDGIVTLIDAAAAGDHLVVVGQAAPVQDVSTPEVTVAWTDDLDSWTTSQLGAERPTDLPDDAGFYLVTASVEANGTGWMASIDVAVPGATDLPSDPSSELAPYLTIGGWGFEPVPARAFAKWDGEPMITRPVAGSTIDAGVVIATNTGFLHVSEVVRYTDDGLVWHPRALLPQISEWADDFEIARWSTFGQALPTGLVVFVGEIRGNKQTVFLVDDLGESWLPIDVPGLPSRLTPAQMSDGNGIVVEAGNFSTSGMWIVATPDGKQWFIEQYHSGIEADYEARVAALHDRTLLVGDALESGGLWWTMTF